MKKLLSALLINPLITMPAFARDTGGAGAAEITARDYRPGRIEHIVLFQYKPGVSEAEKAEVRQRFLALKTTAHRDGQPYIRALVTGKQNSLENLHMGFEQGFVLTFDSEGDRNYYVGTPAVTDPLYLDPQHDAFKEYVTPLLLEGNHGALVFDFRVGS